MDLLHIPKQLYYRWEKNSKDECVYNLENVIEKSLDKAQKIKEYYSKQKMDLKWKQFKLIVENIIQKAFDNYIPLDIYENKNEFVLETDLWTEDNFCIKYICKCLQYGIKNYQKKYYGVTSLNGKSHVKYRRCIDCGKLIVINKKDNQTVRCDECQKKYRRKYKTQKDIERYWRKKSEISDSTN
jgi:ribosomal protein S27E